MKTILIVEDDFHIQDIYRMAFVKTGEYSVETASDGQEALVKLSNHVYEVILLDIMLPKVTGIDVLRTIRSPNSNCKNTPVILITNLGQDDIIKEAFKIGADGYLIKAQFTPQDVVKEVNTFFEQMKQIETQNVPVVPVETNQMAQTPIAQNLPPTPPPQPSSEPLMPNVSVPPQNSVVPPPPLSENQPLTPDKQQF